MQVSVVVEDEDVPPPIGAVVVVVPPLLLVDVVLVEEPGVDEGGGPDPLGWDITKMAPDARYSTTATMTIVIPIGETARLGLSFNSDPSG